MKTLIILIVAIILYLISRSYKTQNFQNIKFNYKEVFDGDLREHEAGILVSLMAKVAKADGKVGELEAQILENTFDDLSSHFENSAQIREKLKQIYEEEKNNFTNTVDIANKFLRLSKYDYQKRVQLMQYLLNLAFIDGDFSKPEQMINEDIAKALEIRPSDYKNLVRGFENFYQNVKNQGKESLEDAYKTLGLNQNASLSEIKKHYRDLVKKNHPDIITAKGGDADMISKATEKLQIINAAYEVIKKEKGVRNL